MTPDSQTFWLFLSLFFALFLQPGFLLLQTGFSRANTVVSVLMKNFAVFSAGGLVFFFVGYSILFSPGPDLLHIGGWVRPSSDGELLRALFETVLAVLPAGIVLGAIAGRTRFAAFAIFGVCVSAFIYPAAAKWISNGWLARLGFHDFAGGTAIHSLAGWLALAGVIVVGPRLGKFGPDKKPRAMPGHHILMAGLGLFFLWIGLLAILPGRMTDPHRLGSLLVNGHLSGAAGAVSALVFSWILARKPDPSLTLNGAIGGLVAVAAGADLFSPEAALIVGLASGLIIAAGVIFLESVLHLDDPVGVVSIHALAGTWGTLAVGLFGPSGLFHGGGFHSLLIQAIGAGAVALWGIVFGLAVFFILSKTVGLRAEPMDELKGLDLAEHGMEGYSGFQIFNQ